MDPLSLATVFATVVSLLADFKAQRDDAAAVEFDDFAAWLSENRHEEIIALLQQNVQTTISIKALLHLDRKTLAAQLERMDRLAAALASAIDGIGDLAAALRPEAKLSQQARAILCQYREKEASKLLDTGSPSSAPPVFLFVDGKREPLHYEERQFINDDMMTLVDLGLLRIDHDSDGSRLFVFTRPAAELVALMGAGS